MEYLIFCPYPSLETATDLYNNVSIPLYVNVFTKIQGQTKKALQFLAITMNNTPLKKIYNIIFLNSSYAPTY